MYLRAVHSTYHLPTLYNFIKDHVLGVLTTTCPLKGHPLIQASHIPWVLDQADAQEDDASIRVANGVPLGTLRGHLSRANPQAKALIQAACDTTTIDLDAKRVPRGPIELGEVMVLFTGPIQHYVTPKYYTATKPTTGKVVPTWNYEAVQVYGRITVYPSTTCDIADSFLSKAIEDISHNAELGNGYDGLDGNQKEWLVDDAPKNYIGLLKKAIMGVSIEITSIGGKFKMSQELAAADRAGVIDGFSSSGNEEMAGSVSRWSPAAS